MFQRQVVFKHIFQDEINLIYFQAKQILGIPSKTSIRDVDMEQVHFYYIKKIQKVLKILKY